MKDYNVEVTENIHIGGNLYKMSFSPVEGKFEEMNCGQFLHLAVPGKLLRRPFCLYKFSASSVSIAYAVVGGGTKEMTFIKKSDKLKVTMPLGNGWHLEDKHKNIVLLGGGVGCAPLVSVPKIYSDKNYYAFIGFSDKSRVAFEDDFKANCKQVICTTDDGSYGEKGFPTDALERRLNEIKPDLILVCGPRPMFKAAATLSAKYKIPAYASTEERMGCGVGACLVCACEIKQKDGSHVMRRACADGPVFALEDLVL